jgi:glycosyltransferase involved in cell wall biosynthesis
LVAAPVRVAYVVTGASVGGAEAYLARLVGGLDRSRVEPVVLAPPTAGVRELFDGVPVVELGVSEPGGRARAVVTRDSAWLRAAQMGLRVARLPRARAALRAAITGVDPAVVHVNNGGYPGASAALAAALAAHSLGRRVVLTVHSTAQPRYLPGVEHAMDALVARAVDVAIAVGELPAAALRRRLGGGGGGVAVEVVHPGVPDVVPGPRDEARRRLGLPADALVVGMVGHFVRGKDQALLIDAFAAVAATAGVDAVLVLAGDGPTRAAVERHAASSAVAGRVRFPGFVAAADVLGALDVAVLASQREGLPLSVVEAMAAGLPVVASDVGAVREAVADGETGIVVPPGDRAALSSAIRRLATDAALRSSMGAAGRAAYERSFTVDAMVAAHHALYDALLLP